MEGVPSSVLQRHDDPLLRGRRGRLVVLEHRGRRGWPRAPALRTLGKLAGPRGAPVSLRDPAMRGGCGELPVPGTWVAIHRSPRGSPSALRIALETDLAGAAIV